MASCQLVAMVTASTESIMHVYVFYNIFILKGFTTQSVTT